MSDLNLPRIGYARFKVKGKYLSGEGKQTDKKHLAKDGWIAIYDYGYKLSARDVNPESGTAQSCMQTDHFIIKEAYGNATINCLASLASGSKIEEAEIHIMMKSEGKGAEEIRFIIQLTDGSFGGSEIEDVTFSSQTGLGLRRRSISNGDASDLHDELEKITFTSATVMFTQEPQGKGQQRLSAGYDFNERKYLG